VNKILLTLMMASSPALATTWYVDSVATGAHNGTSWANAWTAISQISGIAPGDTVYLSGGPSGSSQSYSLPSGGWSPAPGTYQIGKDAAHNGIVIFSGSGNFLNGNLSRVRVSGDAGDGKQHFRVGPLGTSDATIHADNTIGFTVSYVNFGQKPRNLFAANPCQGIQIDNCYFYKLTNGSDDSVIWMNMPQTLGFEDSKIFANELHAPYATNIDGWGDDFIGAATYSGVSLHDNKLIGYGITNYAASQHMDGWQALSSNHCKCFNNYYENITNYPMYGDAFYGGMTDFYVFNNVIVLSDPVIINGFASPQGIAIGSQMTNAPFRNVVVANNLVADYASHWAVALGDGGSGTISYQGGNGAWNNVATNNGANPVFKTVGDSLINLNNQNVVTANGVGYFVSYSQNHGNTADFHSVAGSPLIGHGTNLSASASAVPEIMFDRDGNPRPAVGNWDIGPYQFAAGPTPTAHAAQDQ